MNKQHILRNGKEIFKVDCIIADQTHSIKLVLWEEVINQVDCGKSYLFRGLTTRVFDYVKYLSTSEANIIETKDKITNINLTSDEIKDTIIEGQCIGVHIKKKTADMCPLQSLIGYRDKYRTHYLSTLQHNHVVFHMHHQSSMQHNSQNSEWKVANFRLLQ